MRKNETIAQVLLAGDINELAGNLIDSGFKPESLILIGQDASGIIRIKHNCRNRAELVGILTLGLSGISAYYGEIES